MSVTIDCGEGKHTICRGKGRYHYLIPQLDDGKEFQCACPCHQKVPPRKNPSKGQSPA